MDSEVESHGSAICLIWTERRGRGSRLCILACQGPDVRTQTGCYLREVMQHPLPPASPGLRAPSEAPALMMNSCKTKVMREATQGDTCGATAVCGGGVINKKVLSQQAGPPGKSSCGVQDGLCLMSCLTFYSQQAWLMSFFGAWDPAGPWRPKLLLRDPSSIYAGRFSEYQYPVL